MIVVDTNLIAYLLLKGAGEETAKAVLRRDREWAAPILWRSEFRNVLAGHFRRGLVSIADAERAAAHAEAFMKGREHAVRSASVLRLVAGSNCTAYDCEFVALAMELGVHIVTSDREILDAFPSSAVSPKAFAGES